MNGLKVLPKSSPILQPPAGAPDLSGIDTLVADPDRLAAVHASGLLDSPAEDSFDALTRLASRLLNAQASFISIVDSGRDFFKSQVGFPAPVAQDRQLNGRTFCHYTLGGEGMLVIEDTHSDPVWRSVPSVESLGVRAYAGAPL
jgi:GAF domain-containing protein